MSDALVLNTSGLLAALDADEAHHTAARHAIQSAGGALVLSPFVLAELDYLLVRHVGIDAELALLDEVVAGAYTLAPFDADDVARAREVAAGHRDLAIGLADASIVVLAARHQTTDVLTLDERHFRALRPLQGGSFRLLPIDG